MSFSYSRLHKLNEVIHTNHKKRAEQCCIYKGEISCLPYRGLLFRV